MHIVFTILGCGSSGGVPRVGNDWGACDPHHPKNWRMRTSLLIEARTQKGEPATTILIDTSPDLRMQLLKAGVTHLDAILLTHPHADHIHGIDDVRPLVLRQKKRIDCYMDEATAQEILPRFSYIFETPEGSFYPPLLKDRRILPPHSLTIEGKGETVECHPFVLGHGEIDVLGFRIGNVAYTPDLNFIPESALPFLQHLDLWIVDALRETPHASHFCLRETLEWIARLEPKRAILTNLHNDLDYETLRQRLPPHIEPAFDGLQMEYGI